MSDIISIQYDQMKQLSSDFQSQAEFVKQVLDSLTSQMQVLSGGDWIAPAATAFYASMNDDLLPGVQRLIRATTNASDKCGEIVSRFQAVEEEAKSCVPSL